MHGQMRALSLKYVCSCASGFVLLGFFSTSNFSHPGTNITVVKNNVFNDFSGVLELNLTSNAIVEVEPSGLAGLSSLEHLLLTNNHIK